MKQLATFSAALQTHWRGLAPREQSMLAAVAALIALALIWLVLLAPSLRTLSQAESQQRSLNLQLQTMLGLQQQAKTLQAQPKIRRDEALRALETSVQQRLGSSAQLNVVGDRVTLTLTTVPAAALAEWLAQARINAHVVPSEAALRRSAASTPSALPAWDGTLVLSLPTQ
jgi:general secretion pathway protein M